MYFTIYMSIYENINVIMKQIKWYKMKMKWNEYENMSNQAITNKYWIYTEK